MKLTTKIIEEKKISVYIDRVEKINEIIAQEKIKPTKILLVTHKILWDIYKVKFAKINIEIVLLPEGEKVKSYKYLFHLYQEFIKHKLDRKSLVVIFGGGVLGDLCGFACGTYMRGINYIQIPTTLLAMIDSSIGGKTAINIKEGKNLIGVFYQPRITICDLDLLKTLPKKEIVNALGEILKYAILNKTVYELLSNVDKTIFFNNEFWKYKTVEEIIKECIKTKLKIVQKDEKETMNIREKLNFGHTIAHSIEVTTNYKTYSHGEAVIIGIIVESYLANKIGILSSCELQKILLLIEKNVYLENIDKTFLRIPTKSLVNKIKFDKKTYQQKIYRFALPTKIGHVEVFSNITTKDISYAIQKAKLWMLRKLN